MKIAVIGGGPGGLYFSILTKKAMPGWQIDVYERNRPDDSFGFGVVFSDETLAEFLQRDLPSYELIRASFAYWDDIVVARDGEAVSISGNGFCGCSRKTLLQLLHRRCREEGVNLHFEEEIHDLSRFSGADILVVCDGIASQIRGGFEKEFGTSVKLNSNRFVWCGSTKPLDAFTYFFRNTPHGLMVAHSYQYEEGMSTWIFECSNETWEKYGFELANEADTLRRLEKLFSQELDGHALIGNKSHWRQFPKVSNRRWHYRNMVLLGDAKATAHYSIGSGTKLAMECAIALSDALLAHPGAPEQAFEQYERVRRGRVESIQRAAGISLSWFEHMNRYRDLPFMQFSFGCMTRSDKVSYENLQVRDASFTGKVLGEFLQKNGEKPESGKPASAAFTPFQLRGLKLENRIVCGPFSLNRAEDGLINDYHFQHYAARALGGPGLLLTETVSVAEAGRRNAGCPGIYRSDQTAAWKRLVDFVHAHSAAAFGIEIGHTSMADGQPGAGEEPLISSFIRAAENARDAGFDWIQLRAGDLIGPDGAIHNEALQLEFALKLFAEVRRVFPLEKPISVQLPARTEEQLLKMAADFSAAGADIIGVSAAGPSESGNPSDLADALRNGAGIAVMAGGNAAGIDQINTLLLNGKADLVSPGTAWLTDPSFALRARAWEGLDGGTLPQPVAEAYPEFSQQIRRNRKQTESMKKALKPRSNKL